MFQYNLNIMTANIFKQINMAMVPLFQCQYNLYNALEKYCTYWGTYTTLERHKGGVIHFNTRLPIHKKCVSVRYKNTKSVYPKRNTPLHPWRHMFIFNIYGTRHYLSVRPNLISHWGAEKDTLPIADVTKPSRLEMKHDIILKGTGRAWGGSLLNYSKITPWHLKW